jgi:hypothetical protein
MKASKRHALLRCAMVYAAFQGLPVRAFASGQMPILALPVQFNSNNACVAALEAAFAEDLKLAAPLTVAADGKRREVTIESKGVEYISSHLARYDVTIWYHNGVPRTDLPQPQIEFSHSYEHPIRQCEGKTMTIAGTRGYTLSTFVPLTEMKPP